MTYNLHLHLDLVIHQLLMLNITSVEICCCVVVVAHFVEIFGRQNLMLAHLGNVLDVHLRIGLDLAHTVERIVYGFTVVIHLVHYSCRSMLSCLTITDYTLF
jgi:hypothetical protein